MAMIGSPLLARVHQSVEKVRYARAGGPAHRHGIAAQVGIGDRGEDAVFFMANVDELDLPVAPQRVDHRIQRIPDDAVAAFDAGLRQHLPHHVRNFLCHGFSFFVDAIQKNCVALILSRSPLISQLFTHSFNHFTHPSPTKPPIGRAILESTLCPSASAKRSGGRPPLPCPRRDAILLARRPALCQHPGQFRFLPHLSAPLCRFPRLAYRQLLLRV